LGQLGLGEYEQKLHDLVPILKKYSLKKKRQKINGKKET
jgi:hypothetical protein